MTVESPLISGSSLEKLTDWCRSAANLDAAGIEKFFHFLQPSPDLRQFGHVIRSFQTLLPLLEEADSTSWQRPEVGAFLALCRKLNQEPAVLAGLELVTSRASEPLLGVVKRHPVYCLLSLDPAYGPLSGYPDRQDPFRRLQAYVLNAMRESFDIDQAKLDQHGSDLSPYGQLQSQIAGAELSARKVARGLCPAKVLDLVPEDMCSLASFQKQLSVRAKRGVAGPSRNFAARLDQLFTLVLGSRDPKAVGGGSSAEKNEHYEAVGADIGWDDESVTAHVPARHTRQFANIGISATDALEIDTTYHSGESVQITVGDSPALAMRRSRGKLRAMARRNQHLPNAFERLTLFEVQRLHAEIANLLRERSQFRPKDDGPAADALAAFLALAFWTGTDAASVLGAKVLRPGKPPPVSARLEQAYLDPTSSLWWPPRQVPSDSKQAQDEWLEKKLVEPVSMRLALQLNPAIWLLLDPWLKTLDRSGKTGRHLAKPLFDDQLQDSLKEEATRFLRHIRGRDSQSRLRLSHIDVHMFHLLADHTGDSVEAALITGRMPLGVESALYYYAPEVPRLQSAYAEASERLLQDLLKASGKPHPRPRGGKLPALKARRIGSQICPTPTFLRSAVKEQIAKVKASSIRLRQRPSLTQWVSFHNDLTSYCVLQLGYGTGLRAVHDPFPTLDDFDPHSGLMVVADKIKEYSSSTRVVWLPDLCQRQLDAYLAYLQRLAEQLVLLGMPYAAGLLADTPGRRGTNLPKGQPQTGLSLRASAWNQRRYFKDETPPLFFFLTELADRWEPVGAAALSAHLGDTYPLPANSNRHYLRTRLREAGVSGEVVDAFMGHGSFGQEPFGRFSALAPFELRQATERAITVLIKDAGWKVLFADPTKAPG